MDSDSELNMSWENEFIRSTDCEITYSPEPMDKIRVQLLFVNSQNQIHNSSVHTYPLTILNDSSSGSELSESSIMRIITSNRHFQNKRYQCENISLYCLSIEPEHLFNNVLKPDFIIDHKPYFKTFYIPQNIHIPPSLFIFHSVNSIWVIFRELERVIIPPPKQIVSSIKSSNKKTKRVRISNDPPITIGKTRKRQLFL